MRTLPAAVVALLLAVLLMAAPGEANTPGPPDGEPSLGQQDQQAEGRDLYLASCASCHGRDGLGTPNGPSLVGVGAASVDFQLTTGRMPFAGEPGTQSLRKPPAFDDAQMKALVGYVASFGEGPAIPEVEFDQALLPRGAQLYFGNCAPCHGTAGRGGAVGGGAIAPRLDLASGVQVVEAMIVGPGQMPVFDYSQPDLNAVATYVDHLRRAPNPGGFAIGGIGPVPEGFVGWVVGIGVLFPIVYLIGREWTRKQV
jgi:ubiquinol-cytochrome c reductase cytochrome c subunit